MKVISNTYIEKIGYRFIADYFVYDKGSYITIKKIHNNFINIFMSHIMIKYKSKLRTDTWIEEDTERLFERIFFKRKSVFIVEEFQKGWYHVRLSKNRQCINKSRFLDYYLRNNIIESDNDSINIIELCVYINAYWKYIKDRITQENKRRQFLSIREQADYIKKFFNYFGEELSGYMLAELRYETLCERYDMTIEEDNLRIIKDKYKGELSKRDYITVYELYNKYDKERLREVIAKIDIDGSECVNVRDSIMLLIKEIRPDINQLVSREDIIMGEKVMRGTGEKIKNMNGKMFNKLRELIVNADNIYMNINIQREGVSCMFDLIVDDCIYNIREYSKRTISNMSLFITFQLLMYKKFAEEIGIKINRVGIITPSCESIKEWKIEELTKDYNKFIINCGGGL